MTILDLLGWLVLLALACWATFATLMTAWAAFAAGWCSKLVPMGFLALAGGAWFACVKLAPFAVAWRVA